MICNPWEKDMSRDSINDYFFKGRISLLWLASLEFSM